MRDLHPPTHSTPRIAIIGGGFSGLAAAHHLAELAAETGRPVDIHLFDASHRLGGLVQTERLGDYTIERGADSFITNKPGAINLCRRLGLESELVPTDPTYRGSHILSHGRPVPTPNGFNLLVPGNLWALLSTPLLSAAGKLRCLEEWFIPPRTSEGDESLASFTRRRLGAEVLDRIVQPLVGGIYTSDPEHLSLAATLPRFLDMEHRYGGLLKSVWKTRRTRGDAEREAAGARYGLFVSLKGGMSQLIETLADRVQTTTQVHFGQRVHALHKPDPAASTVELILEDEKRTFDHVILAQSAYAMADLTRRWSPELATRLDEIPYASSSIVVSGHNLSDIRDPLDSFGLVIPYVEQRKILAVSYLSRKFPMRAPSGKVILRTFIGGAMQPELFNISDDEIHNTVREELRDLLGVGGTPDFEVLTRYPRAMPQYHVGHLDRVREIRKIAEGLGSISLAGNAFDGVGIPDTIQSGEGAAKRAFADLFRPSPSPSHSLPV